MSKLTQYQTFVSVIEKGSITKAASVLNLSVPAISKQLTQLEENLQVQLFHRSHKKLDISEAGKQFYPRCKAILSTINQAEEELLSDQEAMSGIISITLSKALCRSRVFDALSNFSSMHPLINLAIRFSDELEDLYDADIDFAFRLGQLNDSSTMTAIPLIETTLIACATPTYLKEHGIPKSFAQIGNTKFILPSELNPAGELKAFLNREKFDYQLSVSHTTNDIEGVHQLVNAHLGIGMMLDVSIQRELENGHLISVLADRKLPRKRLYLLSKKSQWETRKQRVFKQYIKAALAPISIKNSSTT
ncbi:LysR family transcriptional regulator [uncultured Vibrio sp.]|uniref:LysR family transcriptional regulator n=1 Tax=uncultured Vibrio sp. TaxID=114054 RepID=UPI0025DB37D0|nr:LysR family transcriptional regulator [uncultured Vibrio sp.]